jgi:hypothetical protein
MTGHKGSIKINENKDYDVEYIMEVDRQFVDRVDDIVKSLELSHFRVTADKKRNGSDISTVPHI